MERDVVRTYLDPKTGYWGRSKMRPKVKHILDRIYGIQRHTELKHPQKMKLMRRIEAKYPFHSVQLDLAFLPKLRSPMNNNVRGFIVVIDVFTRYLFCKTFTSRKSLHILVREILEEMRRDFNKTPDNMTSDNEFHTHQLDALGIEYNFKWYFGEPGEKNRTGISERVIRTIKNLIKRYLAQNNTTRYIDVLPDLVYNYNHTYHRTIRMSPHDSMTSGTNNIKPNDKWIPELENGTKVRVLQRRNVLTKGDVPYWSKEVYEVVAREGNGYIVENTETHKRLASPFPRYKLYVLKGDPIHSKYKEDDEEIGYDEGIERNRKRNTYKRRMSIEGMDLNNMHPADRRELMEEFGDMIEYDSYDEEKDNFGRIDDIGAKWDKLTKNKYEKMPTNADGACLFNALVGFLKWEKGEKIIPGSERERKLANKYRQGVVKFFKDNLDVEIEHLGQTFKENIKEQLENENDNRSVYQYLEDMKKRSEWGGQAEIIAVAVNNRRNILVYVDSGGVYKKYGGFIFDDKDEKMILLYWNQRGARREGTHYEYLIPKERNYVPEPQDVPQLRRSRRISKKPKPFEYREGRKEQNVNVLEADYKDAEGYTAEEWGEENEGMWRPDKRKKKWLLIVKDNGELRYEGIYDTEKGDKFEDIEVAEKEGSFAEKEGSFAEEYSPSPPPPYEFLPPANNPKSSANPPATSPSPPPQQKKGRWHSHFGNYTVYKPIKPKAKQIEKDNVKILPSTYTDKLGYWAKEWGKKSIGMWVEDKEKNKYLKIVKHGRQIRYKGKYSKNKDEFDEVRYDKNNKHLSEKVNELDTFNL